MSIDIEDMGDKLSCFVVMRGRGARLALSLADEMAVPAPITVRCCSFTPG